MWINVCGVDLMTDVSDRIAGRPPTRGGCSGGVENLLYQVQDALTVDVGLPWPRVAGGALVRICDSMREAKANGTLVFWFEDVRGQ